MADQSHSFRIITPGLLAVSIAILWPTSREHASLAAENAATDVATTELTGRVSGPSEIELNWKHATTEPAGCWIEFMTPGADFIKLSAVWRDKSTFRHTNVAPDTRYIYRAIPFFGQPSEVVAITTERAPPQETIWTEIEGPVEIPNSRTLGRVPLIPASRQAADASANASSGGAAAGNANSRKSIRKTSSAAEAAPNHLTGRLSLPVNVVLRWTDRAADEDGYLVEISRAPNKDFRICALLPPDTRSFRKVALSPETTHYFRVRAFYYGLPSNLASVMTPRESRSASPTTGLTRNDEAE